MDAKALPGAVDAPTQVAVYEVFHDKIDVYVRVEPRLDLKASFVG